MKRKIVKSVSVLAIACTCLLGSGCSQHPEYDGMVLKDATGKFYKLENRVGDVYFVHNIEIEIEKIEAFK